MTFFFFLFIELLLIFTLQDTGIHVAYIITGCTLKLVKFYCQQFTVNSFLFVVSPIFLFGSSSILRNLILFLMCQF